MSFTPRWYQQESVDAFFNYYFNDGGQEDGLICLPTAAGKSFTLSMIIKGSIERVPHARIMMLTHVKELIEQNHESLKQMWPQAPAGIYSAGLKKRQHDMQITSAGIQSVCKKAHLFGVVNLVIVDECHTISAKDSAMYQEFFAALRQVNPRMKVQGLTATPYRLDCGAILGEGKMFGHMIYNGCTMQRMNRMIDEGYLAPLVPKSGGVDIDTSKLVMRGGEYTQKSADDAINRSDITRAAVAEIVREFKHRNHLMIFAQSVDHCGEIAKEMASHGVQCVQVHSKMSSSERDENIRAFKAGDVPALVNMGVLTTGFNFPALDMLAVLRLTQSTALHLQIMGRGMRVSPETGKVDCLVLDYAGNTKRLGCVNDPVIPKGKGNGKGVGEAPVKECPECASLIHASVMHCAECGHIFESKCNLTMTSATDQLIKREQYRTVDVSHVVYNRHKGKGGKPDSLRVTYTSGLTTFNEWVHLEGAYRQKAQEWVTARTPFNLSPPMTIDGFLAVAPQMLTPKQIIVDTSGKYANIKHHIFNEKKGDEPF